MPPKKARASQKGNQNQSAKRVEAAARAAEKAAALEASRVAANAALKAQNDAAQAKATAKKRKRQAELRDLERGAGRGPASTKRASIPPKSYESEQEEEEETKQERKQRQAAKKQKVAASLARNRAKVRESRKKFRRAHVPGADVAVRLKLRTARLPDRLCELVPRRAAPRAPPRCADAPRNARVRNADPSMSRAATPRAHERPTTRRRNAQIADARKPKEQTMGRGTSPSTTDASGRHDRARATPTSHADPRRETARHEV